MEYAFLSIFVIVPVYIFIYRLSVGLTVNYVSFWFFNFIIFCWVGTLLISLNIVDNTYFVHPIGSNSEIKTIGSILVLWGGCGPFLIFMGLFYYFKLGRIWREKHQEKIIVNASDIFFSFSCFIMLLACFLYYVVATYPSPLVMALNGASSTDIAIRRIAVTRNLSEIANTFIISFGVVLTYFSTYSLYGLSVGSSNKFRYRFFFYVSFFVSCLYLLLSGEKAPVVYFLIGICLLVKYCKGEVLKLSLKFISIPVLLMFLVYYLLVSRDLIEILRLLSDRIFIAQVISVYLSFDLYSMWGDIGLDSISNFITKVFGLISRLPASTELMEVYFYEMVAVGGWNINGLYIYEAWSNFGLLGVLLAPVFVGTVNFYFLSIILKFSKSSFSAALYVFSTLKCTYYLTSFNSYLYHSDWIWIIILFLLFFCSKIMFGSGFIDSVSHHAKK